MIALSRKHRTALAMIGFLCLMTGSGCDYRKEFQFSGPTMGTTYHITIKAPFWNSMTSLDRSIREELAAVNKSMSVYDKESEISRFNAIEDTRQSMEISERFAEVLSLSKQVWDLTEGAFDPTVFPLVRIWGFYTGNENGLPDEKTLEAIHHQVGFGYVRFDDRNHIGKCIPEISLDLGAIAKGYGVDQIAAVIRKAGYTDFLVEIGGEVVASGRKASDQPWRIGINYPDPAAPLDLVYKSLTLQNKAIATSGDYRNFRQIGGKRYAHIIDPRTGSPIDNGVVSVSVIADTCALADGLATGLMVMGHEKGIALVEGLPGTECLYLVKNAEGALQEFASSGFGKTP
ncbi:FAD:protein FMN transferase [Desulfatirhabdium butyrativorans]|uniref:FAD:protein FMN transferase n=1 Tax=Desulfatirhabdium butyrativorans TaxID=340467 RepID=UPI0004838A13|nr:FAD:protein FMN transferase [Desulfatirhabdium butyrativorans]